MDAYGNVAIGTENKLNYLTKKEVLNRKSQVTPVLSSHWVQNVTFLRVD